MTRRWIAPLALAAMSAISFVLYALTLDTTRPPLSPENYDGGGLVLMYRTESVWRDHQVWLGAGAAFALSAVIVAGSLWRRGRDATGH